MENGRFNVNRITHNRNSYLPIIVGQFHEDLGFTRIEITMRLHYFVMALLAVGLTMFFSFMFMLPPFFDTSRSLDGNGPPIILFLLLMIVLVSFNYEANKARRMLEALWTTD